MTTLPDYIGAHLDKPFRWGANDCVLFAIGWLEIATGRDYLSEHKPWSSAKQAMRKVEKLGGLAHLFDANLERINPHLARDGDLCVVEGTASLFSGAHVVSVGEDGLIFKDRTEAACAWRCQSQTISR